MIYLHNALDYSLLALGLGFVIFVHELGHFLAAKYCDVKVEQFAIGFGPAVFAWRKGIGFRWGSTTSDYNRIVQQHFEADQKDQSRLRDRAEPTLDYSDAAAKTLGLGETEYRFNWIPLGGYVKMLGQDDLRPGVTAEDPRAYNRKSVGARMLIVSAGVIMNVVFSAVGFMTIFMIGYPVPPATVGSVIANSPAARAASADGTLVGLQPGDVIVSYNGKDMAGDFSRIPLNVALTHEGQRVAIVVQHPDGAFQTLYASPEKPGIDGKGLLQLGVGQPFELAGPEVVPEDETDDAMLAKTDLPDVRALSPADRITQIAGQSVKTNGNAAIAQLYAALNASDGKPIDLTIESPGGRSRHETVTPHFAEPFAASDLTILGMTPRASVIGLLDTSPALDQLKPGDVILAVDAGADHRQNPTCQEIRTTLAAAGDKQLKVSLTVLDPGQSKPRIIEDLMPYHIPKSGGRMGLGISLGADEQHLVVAQTLPNSPAAGKIPAGATLTDIDSKPVANWFELRRLVAGAKPGQNLAIAFIPPDTDGKPSVANVSLKQDDIDAAKAITLTQYLPLHPMISNLQTHNPLVALARGVDETRDLILEFYVTLQRMVTGDVGLSNVMGPVGMAHEGAQVASRGFAWLLWFLCLISANLAVVNFLPIPIVDGGLFTLLILEKLQGKALSADAQRIVQMVGLVLILGVFLLVTYQDIARMWGY
ncbi:MAG: site-2 protease family protein [Tepidisphaeraceae bacterium]|jgi:regulator of sigma E protease